MERTNPPTFLQVFKNLGLLKDMTLHKITKFCTEWFSVCLKITSEFRIIAIFEFFVKQNRMIQM
jgi:hypothetical protein